VHITIITDAATISSILPHYQASFPDHFHPGLKYDHLPTGHNYKRDTLHISPNYNKKR